MFQSRQQHLRLAVEVVSDFDDGRHRIPHLAEELQAYGAHVRRHSMQNEARRGDDAVAAFLLYARQAVQPFIGDVLAEAGLAKCVAGDFQNFGFTARRAAVGLEARQSEARGLDGVDLAEVVVETLDFEPAGVRHHHAPPREIVETGAPQHRFLAAGIHRDVAADGRSVGRRRIAREHQAGRVRRLHRAFGDDTGATAQRRHRLRQTGQGHVLHFAERFELFGVDHRRVPDQRDCATGIAGAAAARNDRKPELDAGIDDRGDLVLGVGMDNDERILDAPVGSIGHVRHPRQSVELDVVPARDASDAPQYSFAQCGRFIEFLLEAVHRAVSGRQQLRHVILPVLAPRLDLLQPLAHRRDQRRAPLRIGQQVILQVRIARHHPEVAQHFVKHPRRTAGAALVAQLAQHLPQRRAEKADHDFAIGKRCVVVRDFAQASGHGEKRAIEPEILLQHTAQRSIDDGL